MLLHEAISVFEKLLTEAGVSAPRTNVEWILCSVLGLSRTQWLLASPSRVLSALEEERAWQMIRRRIAREPLQYILGSTWFCGCEVGTAPGVLVPRPETELLAECGWQFLQKRLVPKVLDYCSGSGCISFSLALHASEAQIWAVEISPDALRIARANAERLGVEARIHWRQGDSLDAVRAEAPFDLILSNPPYIPTAEIATLEPEVSEYEPALALDGGPDGLKFYRLLAESAPDFLSAGGALMAEFGEGQFPAIAEIFHSAGWATISPRKDYTQRERFFVAHYRVATP